MSFGCWKLSAAVILLSCLQASAQSFDTKAIQDKILSTSKAEQLASYSAISCTMDAASVLAQLSDENARDSSLMAHVKCRDKWKHAYYVGQELQLLRLQLKEGHYIADEILTEIRGELKDSDFFSTLDEVATDIALWRAQAKLEGDEFYKGLRAKFAQSKRATGVYD